MLGALTMGDVGIDRRVGGHPGRLCFLDRTAASAESFPVIRGSLVNVE
jgi:hypothetical protein